MRRLAAALIVIGSFWVPASAYGLGWASEPLTPPAVADETRLEAVSCSSSSFCASPGWYLLEAFESVQLFGTYYNWNGSSWSSAGELPEADISISSSSCTSSSFCVAVGDAEKGSWTYASHWNGTKWNLVSTPNPNANQNQLNGVSCSSSTACTAVGSREWGKETLAIRWNGTSWSTQTTTNPGTANGLNGVSCTSSTHCVAVGSKTSSGTETTMAMTWNGTSWTTQTTPNPAGALSASATAISCTSSTACVAVGVYHASNGPLPFAMH